MTDKAHEARANKAEHRAFTEAQRADRAELERDHARLEMTVMVEGRTRGLVEGGHRDVARDVAGMVARPLWTSPLHVGNALDLLKEKEHYLLNPDPEPKLTEKDREATRKTVTGLAKLKPQARLAGIYEAQQKGSKVK